MALQKQQVEVEFRQGLDTKTNQKLVVPGLLLSLQNGIFREGGTITKRNGYTDLTRAIFGSTATLAESYGLGRFNDELLQFAGSSAVPKIPTLYTFLDGQQKWADRGELATPNVRIASLLRNTYQQSNADCAVGGGVLVVAWEDGRGGIRGSVIDQETGATILADTSLDATAAKPVVVNVGRYTWVVYIDGANLRARRLDTSNPTAFDAEVTLAANVNATGRFDAVRFNRLGFDTDLLFAYNSTTPNVTVGFLLDTGIVGSGLNGRPAVTPLGGLADRSIAIAPSPNPGGPPYILVVYANSTTGVRTFEMNADLTTRSADASIDASTACSNVTFAWSDNGATKKARIFYELTAAASYNSIIRTLEYTSGSPGTIGGTSVFRRSVGLAGKAFARNYAALEAATETAYVVCPEVHDSTLQSTYFFERHGGAILAKLAYGTAGGLKAGHLPRISATATDVFIFAALQKGKFVSEANEIFTLRGVSLATLEWESVTAPQMRQLGKNGHLTGGLVSAYDGFSAPELGFHLFPHDVAVVAGAGGSMATGTYGFAVVWEWTDNQGQIHRSAPSIAGSVVVTGPAGSFTLTIPSLRITGKTGIRTDAVAAVYTTEANGTVYYKTPHQAGSVTLNPVYNNPAADTISFQRTVADASILSNELLYTTGGVLENIAPPAPAFLAVGKNRLWLVPGDDRGTVWYSKGTVDGEGIAFSDLQTIRVDPAGGDITSLEFMDDKLVIFKRDNIYIVAGEGPDDTGANSTLSEPVLVTTDVGCSSPRSVGITPDGLVFQTPKGIYLLTRGLEAGYIGAPVEAFNGQEIRQSLLVEDQNQVRFLVASGDTLVYDYFFRQWSSFTAHEGTGAALFNGAYVYSRADATVRSESTTTFTDSGAQIRMLLETAWIKVAGIQGFQRVYQALFLGDFKSNHTLRVRVAFDYQPYSQETFIFVPQNVLTSSSYGDDSPYGAPTGEAYGGENTDLVYQFVVKLARQKCESIKFEIVDLGGDAGQAYSINHLLLEVGTKDTPFKLRDGKIAASS